MMINRDLQKCKGSNYCFWVLGGFVWGKLLLAKVWFVGGANLCSCVCDDGGAGETVVIVIERPEHIKQI